MLSTRNLLAQLVVPIYLPTFISGFGLAMLVPVLPLYLTDRGIALDAAAVVLSGIGLGNIVGAWPAGAGLARLGERTTLIVGFAFMPVVIWLLGFTDNVSLLLALQAVAGVCAVAIRLSRHSWTTRRVPTDQRGRALALVGGSHRLSLFLAPFLGGWLVDAAGFRAAFTVAGAITTVGLLPAFWSRRKLPLLPEAEAVKAGRGQMGMIAMLGRHGARLLKVGGAPLLVMTGRQGRYVVLPLVSDELGVSATGVGAIVTASTAADLLLFPVAGWVMDRFGRLQAMVPAFGLFAAGLVILAFADTTTSVVAAGVIMGIGNGLSAGSMLTLGSDFAPAEATSAFLAGMATMSGLGQVLGPMLVGIIGVHLGLSASSAILAAVMVVGIGWLAVVIGESGDRGDRGEVGSVAGASVS